VIFVTVGTQLAFDRLVNTVDAWAAAYPDLEVFGQIGPSSLQPQHMAFSSFLSPPEVDKLFRRATLVVAHAGMGSILSALRYKKPILIMPRKAALGEHRNDHQLATAKWLGDRPGVTVAWDEQQLSASLSQRDLLSAGSGISDFASDELIQRLGAFIRG